MGLIDDNEADWKIICIDEKDPLADRLDDIDDIESLMPGYLGGLKNLFQTYKIPQGNLANKLISDGKFFSKEFIMKIIKRDHQSWRHLINGDCDKDLKTKSIARENTTLKEGKTKALTETAAKAIVQREAKPFIAEPAVIDRLALDRFSYCFN